MSAGVGTPGVRPDAAAKLAGTFGYAGQGRLPDELHGATIRSTVASGWLDSVDVTDAMRVPGARVVLTADDVPGSTTIGLKIADQPVFAIDRVRHVGEPVAFAVATSASAAREMAAKVRLGIRPTAPLLDPEAAMLPGAPLVGASSNEVYALRLTPDRHATPGPVTVSATWRTGRQDACFLAPEAGVAHVAPDGTLVLDVATQDVHEDRRQVAAALGLDPEQVLVRLAGVGGAFGGREDVTVQVHLALAALVTGRPVRTVYSRAESLLAHPSRHPARLAYRLSAGHDGTLVSLHARILLDGGAYASTSMPVTKIVHYFAAGAYRVPHVDVETRAVLTNNPVAGALRGFGATQACFGIESTMDLLAAELGADPLELRRRNLLDIGEPLATSGQRLPPSRSPRDVLEACAAVPLPSAPPSADVTRGVGYAVGIKSAGLGDGRPDGAGITLRMDRDGVHVLSAAPEVGQGIGGVLQRVVTDVFPTVPVVVERADSGLPVSGGSKASRQSMASGGAAHGAARLLARAVEEQLGRPPLDDEVVEVTYRHPGVATEEADPVTGRGDLHQTFQLTAHRAVVDVDRELGTATVVQVVAAQDVGRVIDPAAVRGQLVGGTAQGIGFALMEQIEVDDAGVPSVEGFLDYPIPRAADVGEIVPVVLEGPDDRLVLGARGMGEGPLVSSPAAVAAALRIASGRPVHQIPATAEDLRSEPA
jgi:CO/xanthine dehydrogenase Mo-binding subunit